MQIVLATNSLEGIGGSEVYVVTAADHLQRLGHDVWLHAAEHGRATELAEQLGVRVSRGEHELPPEPDVLVAQDAAMACDLAVVYPRAPQVFVAQSDIFDLQLPPALPGLTACVVVLYARVERRIRALGLKHEIVRLNQPVDAERFKPTRPLRERPRVALTMGNYVHGERSRMLERACARARIELLHIGRHGSERDVAAQHAYNRADIVFGKARVVHEAMACGRAVYVFDHNGGEGWVTAGNYAELVEDNFGGQSRDTPIDEDRLVDDLASYDPSMGIVNRDLIVANHSATKHAAMLVEVLRRLVPREQPVDAPLRELARLVRLYHRADGQAFLLHAEAERLAARTHELERDLEGARADAEAAQVRAAEAEAELAQLKATRRWRAAVRASAPLDRLRAIRRTLSSG